MPEGPLAGVRILEFSEMIAAPFAGMHLGDLGADIIKVEPVTGEPWRLTGQFAPNESWCRPRTRVRSSFTWNASLVICVFTESD